jgi:putative metalloenzyme radical SAM/SPASM domain maturase
MEDKPKKLNIEASSRCNLNCDMCMRKVLLEETGDMSLETYKALLPVFPELESVNIIGIGEPLLNENIIEMIKLGKRHLPSTGTFSITTNATLIDSKMARELVDSRLDDLVVSIDGATAETFNDIRKQAAFDEVLKNIGRLNKAKKELESVLPRLGFEFVAMKKNIAELPQLVDLADRYSVSFILVTNLLPHTEDMVGQVLYDYNSDKAIELFNEAVAEAKLRNLDLAFENLDVENYASALFGVPPLKDKLRHPKPLRKWDERLEKKYQLLDDIVAKAREQNVVLNFKNLMARDGTDSKKIAAIFDQASAKAQKYGIRLDLPPLIPKAQRECGFMKSRIAFISWDGYVRPCNNLYHSYVCYVNNRKKSITSVSFGNVNKQSFWEIWNSREYRSFRRNVDKFDFAPCGDCPHAEGCFALLAPVFRKDCYEYTQPCGDCPWARGILKCM